MTRSVVVVFVLNFCIPFVPCIGQGNYIIHAVPAISENGTSSATESPIKFTRKTSTERTSSSATVRPVYRPPSVSTSTPREDQNEVTQRVGAPSEYASNDLTSTEKVAVQAGSAFTTSAGAPDKFAPPYTDRNKAFSETLYREKICKNEPTCDMAKLAPEELTSLGTRNCMCDEDCRKYGDCCLDSPFYNATEQRQNYQSFFCSEQELVYMKTKCPEHYAISNVVEKCAKSSQPLASDDVKLATPVTNPTSKITYGNEYCAQCHHDYEYRSWNFTYYCSEDTFVNTLKVVDADDVLVVNETATVSPVAPVPVRDYLWEMNEAAKHVKYDPLTKSFHSTFNYRNYICSYYRFVSENMRQHVRTCIPNIAECSSAADPSLVEKCLSYTAIVYNKNVVYKNKDCANCNGRQRKDALSGCKFQSPNSPSSSLV